MVAIAFPPITLEAFELLPDTGDRWELIAGEPIALSATSSHHSACAMRIGIFLGAVVLTDQLGEVYGADAGFLVQDDPPTVRIPDIAFVRRERLPELGDTARIARAVPDFVVEVVSPSDVWKDVWAKAAMWLSVGVTVVWVVDPVAETVVSLAPDAPARHFTIGEILDLGALIPAFQLPVADIFPD